MKFEDETRTTLGEARALAESYGRRAVELILRRDVSSAVVYAHVTEAVHWARRSAVEDGWTFLATFRVGDIVRLKSGGPIMTITHFVGDGNRPYCEWFGDQGLAGRSFPPETLERATSSGRAGESDVGLGRSPSGYRGN
jgi:uncharacterized protein YodC (DUF2158 family)